MASRSKRTAAPPLEWRGHLDAVDDAGDRRASVTRDEAGWLIVVHGQAVNDEGTSYSWSRQELGDDGHPVRHELLEDALALAGELAERFEREHLEAEEIRRVEEPKARAAAIAEAERLAAELADAEGAEGPTV